MMDFSFWNNMWGLIFHIDFSWDWWFESFSHRIKLYIFHYTSFFSTHFLHSLLMKHNANHSIVLSIKIVHALLRILKVNNSCSLIFCCEFCIDCWLKSFVWLFLKIYVVLLFHLEELWWKILPLISI
jgi:hypothetical protein